MSDRGTKVRLIPLGGLGEIGKNMMVVECGEDIIVIDCGVMFPEEEMLGVDLVIPDVAYLLENKDRVRGIVITHGHEDHIGALPYILKQLNLPVYSTRLTNGLISVKLKEHGLLADAELAVVNPGTPFHLGQLRLEFFRVSHSIPDAAGVAIFTPLGVIVHTGDFKFDHTPVDGFRTDVARLAELGTEGVLLLMSDSTYAEVPGYTASERALELPFDNLMGNSSGRVIVACFASLVSRMQQVINAAYAHNRRVFVAGRSMVDNLHMAAEMGYLNLPPGILLNANELKKLPDREIAILATGSQGEPTSVLTRIANRDHRNIQIQKGDTVVLSATPIPGNEVLVSRTVDNLFREGAHVLYSAVANMHVHGHGSQEELKLMLSLVKPKYFVPVHGEYRHLLLHSRIAHSMGIPPENTFVMVDGEILEVTSRGGRIAGKIPSDYVYVDGLSVGDIGTVVLRDRRTLSRDGMIVVIMTIDKQTGKLAARPDIVSRGFVEPENYDELIEESRKVVTRVLEKGRDRLNEIGYVNTRVKESLSDFLYQRTKRRPMILPVSVEV
ncbi:MAG: ribonuclease J [Dehalococcoidia bacterium]|nr:ribonuclease J [Dehalococcoidia bacterium]